MPMHRKGSLSSGQLIFLGLLMAGSGVAVPATMLPSALAEERAYTAAEPCPRREGAAQEGSSADCLLKRRATVAGKESIGSGDNKSFVLALGFPDGSREELRLRNSDHQEVAAGEPVTVVSWRHEIREIITRDDERVTSRAYPVGTYIPLLLAAVFLTPLGASLLWIAHRMRQLRRAGRSLASTGRWHVSVPPATAVLYGFAAMLAIAVAPSAAVAGAAAGGVAVCAVPLGALAWRRQRNTAGPKAAALLAATGVRIPVGETVITARVRGDVPYSRDDCDHLALGPAGLAVTPDAGGLSWRVPLPGSLTFVRLHGGQAVGRIRGITRPRAVECRDGDREVLIAADRDQLPWILGALRLQPWDAASAAVSRRAPWA